MRAGSISHGSSTFRVGLEVGEVVLLLQPGVLEQLRRRGAVARERSTGIESGTTTLVAARQPSWCWSHAHS